jgi:hypothetical protein
MRLKMASLRFYDDSIVSTALRSRLEQDLLESIATQILVKFVILKHAAAWKSRPHPVLIATSLSALAAAPLLVFSRPPPPLTASQCRSSSPSPLSWSCWPIWHVRSLPSAGAAGRRWRELKKNPGSTGFDLGHGPPLPGGYRASGNAGEECAKHVVCDADGACRCRRGAGRAR